MTKKPEDQDIPKPNEVLRHKLGDSFDGMNFILDRMGKHIVEGSKDPLVITTARKIGELAIAAARQLGREVNDDTRDLICLEGLHAWCRRRFEYLADPAGIELIQSTNRMLRGLDIPEEIATAFWEPIRDALAKKANKDPATLTLPDPKVTGDSDEAVILSLSLAVALNITPVKIMLGGSDGQVHYAWGAVWAGGWTHLDILHPTFGAHETAHYNEYAVPGFPVAKE